MQQTNNRSWKENKRKREKEREQGVGEKRDKLYFRVFQPCLYHKFEYVLYYFDSKLVKIVNGTGYLGHIVWHCLREIPIVR